MARVVRKFKRCPDTIMVDFDHLVRLRKLADHQGIPKTQLYREAIRDLLNKYEKQGVAA
jgi:Ribbon-helix-helix domain